MSLQLRLSDILGSARSRSHWSYGLQRGSAAARFLELRVRIPPVAWMFVVCHQVEVSATGRSLVQRNPTDCGVSDCDREASIKRRPWPTGGCCPYKNITITFTIKLCHVIVYVRFTFALAVFKVRVYNGSLNERLLHPWSCRNFN